MNAKVNTPALKLLHLLLFIPFSLFISCSVSKKITKQATAILLEDTAIRSGHIGISIYEPANGKYWYNYDAEKYFVPASNTKLFTLYAGMKYLGDSLAGLRYEMLHDTASVYPTGDPTFLHEYFPYQPVMRFLKKQKAIIINSGAFIYPYGKGWAWDDYMDDYMVPRSAFPMYADLLKIKWINKDSLYLYPEYFNKKSEKDDSYENGFSVKKSFDKNAFIFLKGDDKVKTVPFNPDLLTGIDLLIDTLKNKNIFHFNGTQSHYNKELIVIHSQSSDSLFKPMMHNSDNFFAEQTLLMSGNEKLGYMNEQKMIDTLLNTDLADIPQKPAWVDGSGLSRYNMFTPKDFVYILNKIKNEFGFNRIKKILPTGGSGTLKNYYRADSGYIFAKTGSLSNHLALSGYLITKKNKLLIFSILVNHFQTGGTPVRKAIERFLEEIRKDY